MAASTQTMAVQQLQRFEGQTRGQLTLARFEAMRLLIEPEI